MSHPQQFNFMRFALVAGFAMTSLACSFCSRINAAGLTFVEASDLSNLTPPEAIFSAGAGTAGDNLWGYRTMFGTNGSVYESRSVSSDEDSPQLTQRVSGLTPGVSYDFYAVFWTGRSSNWGIQAGVAPGSLTTTTYAANTGYYPIAGAEQAISAGTAVWDVLPPFNDDVPPTIFIERPADPLYMMLGKAGTAVANGSGEVDVYIDDLAALPDARVSTNRTWFDGVAYVTAGGLSALSATVNRDTGALTLTNPTNTALQIKAISVNSDAGSLNALNWTPITGIRDGAGNASFDVDNWSVTSPADIPNSPHAVALAETEISNTNGGALAANGGTISFGNVWNKSFFEDLRIEITLADGSDTLIPMRPTYTGTAYSASDFNRDGAVNLGDYQILLNNINAPLPTMPALSRVETNALGDVTGGGLVDFDDFTLFRATYDQLNGVGAFAQMAAQVPEPCSFGMLLCGAMVMLSRVRSRTRSVAAAVAITGLVAGTSHAVPLLAVDVNSRTGETGVPAGSNTVDGFNEFVLPAGTTIAVASATYGNYQVTMKAVNAAGVPQGSLQDRDRTSPTGTPTLNQLYDDFVFVPSTGTGNVGVGGGIDLAIASGGALQPNKLYSVSIYAYDAIATGTRTANWLDGNSLNAFAMAASFNGSTAPTTDERYKFSAIYRTDDMGNLLLKGRDASSTTTVYIDGFEINEATPELTLEVNITTGAMQLKNEFTSSLELSYYEIRSAAGSLNVGNWTSFDDGEAGDPVGTGWDEAAISSGTLLSELNLTTMSMLAGGSSMPLGSGFTGGATADLRFYYAAPGGELLKGIVSYVQSAPSIPGDFDDNGVVNAADLAEWKGDFGVDGDSDADNDSDSDGADFLVWQRNLGMGASTAAATAAPEPAALSLGALAIAGVALQARRRS